MWHSTTKAWSNNKKATEETKKDKSNAGVIMMMMESMSYKSSQFSSKPFLLLRCFWKTENGKMERRRRKVVETEGCRNFCCYLWDQLSASHDDQVHDDAQFLEEESLAEEKKSCSQGWWYCQCRMVLPSFQVALCMHHACSSTEREEDDDDVDEVQHIPNSEKTNLKMRVLALLLLLAWNMRDGRSAILADEGGGGGGGTERERSMRYLTLRS